VDEVKKIWMDGELVDWGDAKIHVLTHTLHYGLGVFEGIRCYKTARGPAIFRLEDHVDRLFRSALITEIEISYSPETIVGAIKETIKANGMEECYIRPIAYLGYGKMGLSPVGVPTNVSIAVWSWGPYLGAEGLEKGIRVKISSFTRHHPNISMTKAKVCGNYANSILAKVEALRNGYDEAILLDAWGNIAEGTGENVFIVRKGVLKTPPLTSILEGVTRDSIVTLAEHLKIPLVEVYFSRDELYSADEAFLCGTAAELTPIREVDGRKIGPGRPGPITQKLQDYFFKVVRGEDSHFSRWLHPVK